MFIHAEIKTITKWTPKNHEIKNLAQTHKMYADWGQKRYLSDPIIGRMG